MSYKFLFGLRDLGLAGDFLKTNQYGFVYWAELGDPSDPISQRVRDTLNTVMFYTYQSITLPDLPLEFGERAMQIAQIVQPVPGGIGDTLTIEYIAVTGNKNQSGKAFFDTLINYADEAFARWMYEVNLNRTTLMPRNIHPAAYQGTIVYLWMRPDLREIWGGEIITGVTLQQYNGNYSYDSGNYSIRTVSATFTFLERIPLYTVINMDNPSTEAALALAGGYDTHRSVLVLVKSAVQHVLSMLPRIKETLPITVPYAI